MKLGKLSLVAVMALGTSAFAIDNAKVNGGIKFIYQTADWELTSAEKASGLYETGLFKQGNINNPISGASYGGAASGGLSFTVGGTADLTQGVSAGAEVQGFTTLGLENNLVIGSMQGSRLDVDDAAAMAQLWIATTMGKTTVKAGRMELDTPLAFTEKWNLIKNTFDAAVVLNNDLPDTTLVGAWVGKHNGDTTGAGYVAHLNTYTTFGVGGAYAFGAINKSIPNTTVQGWYYNVLDVADAYWLQADSKVMGMVNLGVQYANMDPKLAANPEYKDSSIWAVKASVDVAGVNLYAAYSDADEDGALSFANVSTNDKTKIHTGDGSIYMDGIVTRPGTEAFKIGASTGMIPGVTLAASYCDASDVSVQNHDISAWDVSASGKIGALGLTAIYTQLNNDTDGTSQVYAGRDNDTLRLIATLAF